MRLAIYVPDKGNNGEDSSPVIQEAIYRLCKSYGGCTTSYKARGNWLNPEGKSVSEPVHVLESYVLDSEPIDSLLLVAKDVKRDLSQYALAYTVNDTLFLV